MVTQARGDVRQHALAVGWQVVRQGEVGGLTEWLNKKAAVLGGRRRTRGGSSMAENGQGISGSECGVREISGGGGGGSV